MLIDCNAMLSNYFILHCEYRGSIFVFAIYVEAQVSTYQESCKNSAECQSLSTIVHTHSCSNANEVCYVAPYLMTNPWGVKANVMRYLIYTNSTFDVAVHNLTVHNLNLFGITWSLQNRQINFVRMYWCNGIYFLWTQTSFHHSNMITLFILYLL